MRKLLFLIGLGLAACSAPEDARHPTRAVVAESVLPPMKSLPPASPLPASRSNRDMARDFLDLSFQLESGRILPRLTRFDGPITVKIEGRETASMQSDLKALLTRLRREARIDISQVTSGPANITIHSVTRRNIRRALPNAACFVVPNVDDLTAYRSARFHQKTDWSQLERRDRIAIFLAYDTSPQDIRDCLHEELAQALGPLNDLFRLNDSVFNDDNFQSVLTGFDMLMLRAYYDPALKNGMSRSEVAARLPAILARLNPAGEGRGDAPLPATPNDWKVQITKALGAPVRSTRLSAATQAIRLAQGYGWHDHRLALSHDVLARQLRTDDLEQARAHFERAFEIYNQELPNGPQTTHASYQLAAFDIADGNAEAALARLGPAKSAAMQYQNPAQLASILMLQSEAYLLLARPDEARRARLDSLGWARYGFGPDWAVQARLREIAALNPQNERL